MCELGAGLGLLLCPLAVQWLRLSGGRDAAGALGVRRGVPGWGWRGGGTERRQGRTEGPAASGLLVGQPLLALGTRSGAEGR